MTNVREPVYADPGSPRIRWSRNWSVLLASDPTKQLCDFDHLDDALRCADEFMRRVPESFFIGESIDPETYAAIDRWVTLMRERNGCHIDYPCDDEGTPVLAALQILRCEEL